MTAALLVWVPIILILHTYFLYPLVLLAWRRFRRTAPPGDHDALPSVSVAVAAFNEEAVLEERIQNLLNLDYPRERIEILIGSDGSTDNTNEILRNGQAPNVQAFIWSERRGKAAVLNDLIQRAKGEIVIFSDANTLYEPQTARKLIRHFVDSTVGAVTGELVLRRQTGTVGAFGEASYWSYENRVRCMESDVRTTLGATGAVYAIRRSLFVPLPSNTSVVDDFLIPLRILKQGYNVRYEAGAIAFEYASESVSGEFRRKVRIGSSNFEGMKEFSALLHPRHGFVSFALWSHKMIRWFVPFLLLFILMGTWLLAPSSQVYQMMLLAEVGFLFLGLVGYIADLLKVQIGILGFPYYFLAMNAALLLGFFRFLLRKQTPTWEVRR